MQAWVAAAPFAYKYKRMDDILKISLPLISTKELAYTSNSSASITLHADHLIYRQTSTVVQEVEVLLDPELADLGMPAQLEERVMDVDIVVCRYAKDYTGYVAEKEQQGVWRLDLEFGAAEAIAINWESFAAMQPFIAKIHQWASGYF
jgi:hypothetical protein